MAFVGGVLVAWWLLTPEASPTRVKRAIWIYLSAHYVSVGPLKVEALLNNIPRLGLVTRGNQPSLWHSVPIFVTGLATAGVNIALGQTRDQNLMLQNGLTVLFGYLPIALITAVWSGATGPAGVLLIVIAGAFLALAVGSRAVSGAAQGTPIFAVTSLGGLIGIGLVVLLGGWFIVRLLIPVAVLSSAGIVLGVGVVYFARNYT